jgi:hypothetical protein
MGRQHSTRKITAANMGFSAMLAEEHILIDKSLIGCIMVRLVFATSIEIYSASAFFYL